jgi:hypothetical protein
MIHIDTSQAIKRLKALNRGLSKQQTDKAISLAFNASMMKARTRIGRSIRKKYPASALKAGGYSGGKGLVIDRASPRKLYAKLTVSSKHIPLVFFKHKQTDKGVQVEVLKGKPHVLPFAFIAKGKMPRKHIVAKGRYDGRQGFQVRTKRLPTTKEQRKKNNWADLPITVLVGTRVNHPDPSAMREAENFIQMDVPNQLHNFFEKATNQVIK